VRCKDGKTSGALRDRLVEIGGVCMCRGGICSPAHDRPGSKSGWISISCCSDGRDALAELSREQLIELVLALAAEVAKLKARQDL
jgi:hypothetical protein